MKWLGYSAAENTWEPEANLQAPEIQIMMEQLQKSREELMEFTDEYDSDEGKSHKAPKGAEGTVDAPTCHAA